MDKQKQLEARIQLTKEIMAWQEGKSDCILQLATGTGKTGIYLNIVSKFPGKHLFIVPQDPLKENFRLDAIKLGFEHLLKDIEIICYASLKKYVGKGYSTIGMDESHHVISEARMKAISQIKADKRILLSATLDKSAQEILQEEFEMNIFECHYEEAVERCILPEAEVEVRYITLDDVEVKYPYKFKNVTKNLTAANYYKQLNSSVKYWSDRWNQGKNGEPKWVLNKLLRSGADRQSWLGGYKTNFIKDTLEGLGDERCIVFCASKDQAHRLGGKRAVSSDNTKKQNEVIIEDFNAGKENRIFAKSMLQEGQNLFDTPYGIVGALGTKVLRAKQVLGRILRHDSPKLIILVVAGTSDEKMLEQSFEHNIYGEKL